MTTATFAQDSRTVKADTIDGLICTNFSDWKFMVNATEFWTPTKEDVLATENQIEAYLKKDSKFHTPDLWRKLPKYKRIFCNFFCWSHRPLDDKPVFVFDGGECFFRIQYDLDDKQCYDFNANGDA